jgi:YHS domain-containing protein
VSQGLLTVPLDFGDIFGNTRLFLEIAVRPGGTAGAYTTLAPRQEITPAPYARYAIKALNADAAQNATAAQSVPWTGITGKPATLSRRRLYVPAGGFGYLPSANIAAANWGLNWKNVTQSAGFAVLRPIDWDPTSSFTVTLYFAIPIASSPGTIIWRLRAGGSLMNLPLGSATTGWDGIYDNNTQDAVPLAYYAAGGHSNLMKAQSWTAKWSSTYNTWYFGSGVNTANDFKRNPMWYFAFQRGNAVTNGESYTGDLLVVGADIAYTAVP